jgi:hypothetical protein
VGDPRIQEEMQGDHTFPFLAGKEEDGCWGEGGNEDTGDKRGFAGALEEPGRKQERIRRRA